MKKIISLFCAILIFALSIQLAFAEPVVINGFSPNSKSYLSINGQANYYDVTATAVSTSAIKLSGKGNVFKDGSGIYGVGAKYNTSVSVLETEFSFTLDDDMEPAATNKTANLDAHWFRLYFSNQNDYIFDSNSNGSTKGFILQIQYYATNTFNITLFNFDDTRQTKLVYIKNAGITYTKGTALVFKFVKNTINPTNYDLQVNGVAKYSNLDLSTSLPDGKTYFAALANPGNGYTVNGSDNDTYGYTAGVNDTGVDSVIAKINAIPALNILALTDKPKVVEARSAYDALTAEQKVLVSNLSSLTAAEAKIIQLEQMTDQQLADIVIARISAIPPLSKLILADKPKVVEARTAYDALTATQKALVTNLSTLTADEAKITTLQSINSFTPNRKSYLSINGQANFFDVDATAVGTDSIKLSGKGGPGKNVEGNFGVGAKYNSIVSLTENEFSFTLDDDIIPAVNDNNKLHWFRLYFTNQDDFLLEGATSGSMKGIFLQIQYYSTDVFNITLFSYDDTSETKLRGLKNAGIPYVKGTPINFTFTKNVETYNIAVNGTDKYTDINLSSLLPDGKAYFSSLVGPGPGYVIDGSNNDTYGYTLGLKNIIQTRKETESERKFNEETAEKIIIRITDLVALGDDLELGNLNKLSADYNAITASQKALVINFSDLEAMQINYANGKHTISSNPNTSDNNVDSLMIIILSLVFLIVILRNNKIGSIKKINFKIT